MSGVRAAAESPVDTKMLAISMAPPMLRLDPAPSLSLIPSENLRSFNSMSPEKRPKLSLNTSDLSLNFSGASTSSRNGGNPNTTTTPTTLNTLTNAFDLTYRPSPATVLPSPVAQSLRRLAGTSSSPAIPSAEQPYSLNLPFGVHSILKNSPFPRDVRRSSLCSASASPRIPGRRIFFPAAKKVSFRAHLEEEVTTKIYVMRHVDLSSSDDEGTPSDGEDQETAPSEDGQASDKGQDRATIRVDEYAVRGRRKRKSVTATEELERGREDSSRSSSNRRPRRKKRRWEWTLESVASQQDGSGQETGNSDADVGSEEEVTRNLSASIKSMEAAEQPDAVKQEATHAESTDREASH